MTLRKIVGASIVLFLVIAFGATITFGIVGKGFTLLAAIGITSAIFVGCAMFVGLAILAENLLTE